MIELTKTFRVLCGIGDAVAGCGAKAQTTYGGVRGLVKDTPRSGNCQGGRSAD